MGLGKQRRSQDFGLGGLRLKVSSEMARSAVELAPAGSRGGTPGGG